MRKEHKGWGPTTILAELKYEGQWSQEELPSRSAIGRLLQQRKWSRTYEPNVALPVEDCIKAKRCHSLWQIDGQDNSTVASIGTIAMLNIKDVFSSLYVCSFPARMKTKHGHPCTTDYQTAMRPGFLHHGLPKRLQSDHASVFYENKSKSPFPILFCTWKQSWLNLIGFITSWLKVNGTERTISLGRQVYYISGAKPREQLLITFRKKD